MITLLTAVTLVIGLLRLPIQAVAQTAGPGSNGSIAGVPGWRGRLRYVGRKLFPSAAYMRWRYTLRRDWLLPVWRARRHD